MPFGMIWQRQNPNLLSTVSSSCQLASESSEMRHGVEQGASQQVAGVEKEKERKEIRDRIKHMITGLAGLKAVHSTSVRRWRESLCLVLQLLGGVASRV